MQKTMYTASCSLAGRICASQGQSFNEIWKSWVNEYQPPEEMKPLLEEMGRTLTEAGTEYIRRVPERKYRAAVARAFMPGLEETDGKEKERNIREE